ncbi:MAG TPA: hypothetical protein VFH11_08200 [Gemmatimonadota bacterium]|nr:hypothetical protein [Gemmatimonadota bacterium]
MNGLGSAAMSGAAATVLALAACAGSAPPPGGSWLHPSFGARQLEGETVVVLPVGAVSEADGSLPSDSLATALALRAGEALATGLETGGAAGRAVRPVVAIVELGSLSPEEVRALYDPLTPALLEGSPGGEIPGGPAAGWRDVTDRTGQRYFLLPKTLSIARLEPLRVRATLDAWLVDAASATVLWHAPVSAVNEHAPSGAAADVYGAALDDAVAAAVSTLASRLARLARTGTDDFGAVGP